jgi:large subunit ribosomal protein L23
LRDPHTIIRQPLITEKATDGIDDGNIYVFKVDPTANKIEVRAAVEDIFDVKVVKVNTSNQSGKRKRIGKSLGFTKSYKKAIVTLAPGHKIDIL